LEESKDPREIFVILREFNQKENFAKLSVAEIFFHPSWSQSINDHKSNSVILITQKKIPFKFFIFTTCFRKFLTDQKFEVHQFLDYNTCKAQNVPKSFKYFEIPFKKSGAFYTLFEGMWYLFGFYSQEIIDANVCETNNFNSFENLHRILKCVLQSKTTAKISKVDTTFCPGEIVFQENFDSLDNATWRHENTLRGGGTWEFQWYVPDPENSFVKDGILHIKPTFTDDKMGKDFVTTKEAKIPPKLCTDHEDHGCMRHFSTGTINPIRSASIQTINSLAFKYGIVEIRAKIATGDWLASAITLFPKDPQFYGQWPYSGQIIMMEARGNRNFTINDVNIGVDQIGSNFQFGGVWETIHGDVINEKGFHEDFHIYKLVWSPEEMTTFVDDEKIHQISFYKNGLWDQFKLGDAARNPWKKGSANAPFDKEFYISISLKVGGTAFFPDYAENNPKKPWKNSDAHAATNFWKGKADWENTWKENNGEFQIDYIKITAL
jgi:beta-glucanase (GH16 family)